MGSEQSQLSKTDEQISNNLPDPINSLNEFNWIPSFQVLQCPISNVANVSERDDQSLYIDLRRQMPDIPEPDRNGYQVVKALCFALNYELVRSRKITVFPPSYEYIKYFLSSSIGAIQLHSFQHLSEVIKTFGICSEAECRGDQHNSSEPSDRLLESARKYRHIQLKIIEPTITETDDTQFTYIHTVNQILLAGKVVLFGMPWYSNFYKSQEIPAISLPCSDDFIKGGFCGVIVGFIDKDQQWIVATCRGKSWGDHGYIYLPYHVLTKIGGELVTIELNEELIQLEHDSKCYVKSSVSVGHRSISHHSWNHQPRVKKTQTSTEEDSISITRTLY